MTENAAILNEQRFDHITTFGKKLETTDYADGFNVGTIVCYNVGYSMSLPKFALIVRRTPKMIETVRLPTYKRSTDGGYGFQGYERPIEQCLVPEDVRTIRTRMGKHGFSVEGRWTTIWDGKERWFDHLD